MSFPWLFVRGGALTFLFFSFYFVYLYHQRGRRMSERSIPTCFLFSIGCLSLTRCVVSGFCRASIPALGFSSCCARVCPLLWLVFSPGFLFCFCFPGEMTRLNAHRASESIIIILPGKGISPRARKAHCTNLKYMPVRSATSVAEGCESAQPNNPDVSRRRLYLKVEAHYVFAF